MKIFIGADCKGVEMKQRIMKSLQEDGFEVIDTITPNNLEEDDYPDFAFEVGANVAKNENALGILICSSGIGMSIAANKVKGIRCARIVNEEDAMKAKNHNGANIIAVSSKNDFDNLLNMINIFISTKPVDIERRIRRIEKIIKYENGEYNEL